MAKRRLTLADFTGPDNINTPSPTNTYGIADRDALQAFAWGQDYDVEARRNAIAAALLAKQVAQNASAPGFDQLTAMPNDYRFGGSGDYGMGSGDSPAATGQTPGSVTQQGFFETAQPARSFDADKPPPGPPPDLPPPAAPPPDIPPDPDQGRGRVTVTPTPQAIREAPPGAPVLPEFHPGWENQEDLPIGEDKYGDPADPDKEGADDAGKEGGAVAAPGGGTPGAQGFPGGATGMPSGGSFASAGQGQISATTGNILGGMNQGTFGMPGGMPSGTGYTTSPTGDPIGSKSTSTTSFTAPSAPDAPGAFGVPGAGGFAVGGKAGQQGFNAGGVILGGMNTPSFGQPSGMPGAPAGAKSATGKGDDTDTVSEADVDQALSDMAASMQAANAVAQAMPGAPTPDPSDYDAGKGPFDPGGPGYSPAASQAMAAQAATTAPAGGKSGFAGVGLPGMVADMTAQGMPSPGGGTFSPGFTGAMMGDVDLGDLSSPGAVDTAGLTDTGADPGSGGQGFGGGGAAGGAAGFGGMGSTGAVGGMSTGGTGEIGSVAGGFGQGGFSGNDASMAGGFGGFGSGGFSGAGPGVGMSEGAAAAATDAAAAAAGDVAGTGDVSGPDGNGNGE